MKVDAPFTPALSRRGRGGLEALWYPSGSETWLRKSLLFPLWVLSGLYRAGVTLRSGLYRLGWLRAVQVPQLSVISVGNLTVGGAGKTPAVIFLAQYLIERGRKVAVLSRGYGRSSREVQQVSSDSTAEQVGDEPLLIARRVPQATVLVGSDRAHLAAQAASLGVDTVLLDDGMQHRRLGRDLDLVVVDARARFGNRQMMPRGPLREPLSALSRAELLWLRCESPEADAPPEIRHLPLVRASYFPSQVILPGGGSAPAETLRGKPLFAFGAIARPSSFLRTLEELGVDLRGSRFFGDHYRFSLQDLAELREKAGQFPLITTEKDAVRLPVEFPYLALRLEVRLLSGQQTLWDCLSQRIHSWDKASPP